MRADSASYAARNEAAAKSPRIVIGHLFDVESVYCTSHAGIASVPGVVIEGIVANVSAVSQRIVPDEGRSEIGTLSYELVDLANAFTLEANDKLLNDSKSFRGKFVQLYVGYEGMDFSEFQLFATQIVKDISFADGVYSIACADITREQRVDIFETKKTTLNASLDATATTVTVVSTTGFETVFHGPSYTDAPSSTVGYIKIDDEIIRYTGKTSTTFTGCTRGALNTRAAPHAVDSALPADRRPKVEEYVYLELPGPKLAYAILTGIIYGDSATLPTHWHCGISNSFVRTSDFTSIGRDLWNTSLDTEGFVMRFAGLSKVNAKKFLESEIYPLLGCYSPISAFGFIGLKRMNPILSDSAYVVELNESNVVEIGELKHHFSGMHNRLRIDWNWNGKEFTRSTLFVDTDSITIHGEAPLKVLQFKGLHGSRHTESIIRQRLDAFRDRYSSPPQTITVTVLPSLNRLEIGDVVRLSLPQVRDFAGNAVAINRSFEIQRMSHSAVDGQVVLDLFASSAPASIEPPNDTGSSAALPDGFYTGTGTNLTSVCTINVVGSVGVIQPGTYNLTGNADMNNAGAVYYYAGNLELANGATLTINNNVQLRVRGFFDINGTIDGLGRGKTGAASTGTINDPPEAGTAGFIGNTQGMAGFTHNGAYAVPWIAALTQGLFPSFPELQISVSGSSLLGIPSDLRGTSGGAGGKIVSAITAGNPDGVDAFGGTGADSGAGLCIIARGVAMGASANINLSGDDAVAPSTITLSLSDLRGAQGQPGAGGGGGPGAMLILIDGSSQPYPDVGGRFVAMVGETPLAGSPMPVEGLTPYYPNPFTNGIYSIPQLINAGWQSPFAGSNVRLSDVDHSNSAYRIQYIPGVETPANDADPTPPPITSLSVTGVELANVVTLGLPDVDLFDTVEIYAAITNDRTGAVQVADEKANVIRHQLPAGVTRYYWARTKRGNRVSDWFPTSSTGGVSSASVATFIAQGNCEIAGQIARKVGGATAFDSHVYSLERYLDGAQVTFKPDQTNGSAVVGLNTDPTTDQNWTSIDYAWNVHSDGNVYIVESGVLITNDGAYTTNDIFTVRHDGRRVQYIKNGAIRREVVVGTAAFHMDSSFNNPGTQISRLSFGPANPVRPHPWVARGNCIAGVSTASKVGGSSAWDSDVYSVESYTTCHVVFKPSQTNLDHGVGLNTDPVTDQNYTGIDYWWNLSATGNAYIYESGSIQNGGASYGAYTTSTEFAITYDGANVRYYKDRVLQRTVAISNQRFYADSSFYSPGAAVNSLRFGPGTNLEAVGTPGLEPDAATAVSEVADSSASLTSGGGVVLDVSVPDQGHPYLLICTATFDVWITDFGGGTPVFHVVINGNGSTLATGQSSVPSATASPGQRIAVQASASITTSHEAGSGVVAQLVWTGAQPSGTAEARNVTLRAECIKR